MTADSILSDAGLAAWQLVERAAGPVTKDQMRASLVYAATKTVIDPAWLTQERRHTAWLGAVSARYVGDFDARWDRLIDAIRSQNDLRIFDALDELVVAGERP